LIIIPVGKDLQSVIRQLDQPVDAVFFSHLTQQGNKGLSELITLVNNKKIPSFSFQGRELIEKGLLAGYDRAGEMKRLSRRIAIWTQQILLKEDPKEFKVGFLRQEDLIINIQVAQSLNISPSFSLMAKAELINRNSAISSKAQSGGSSRDAIPISSLVAGESDELNMTAFGLNETQSSLSLQDAVNRALENNLILKARAQETEAVKMDVKDALSKFFPQLGAGLNWTAIDDDHTSAISGVAERSWNISARVSQLLYSEQVYTNLKTSRHLEVIQELSEHQETLDIILETGIAYLNMLKTRANAKIQMDNLKLVRSNLVLANNRYKAGSSGPSDVYRLESEAAISYSTFLDSLAKVGKARLRLNQILNFDQENNTTIKDIHMDDGMFIVNDPEMKAILKINNPKDFRRFRDFVVKKGIATSPEIEAIEEQITIQNDAYNLAKRSYWSPNVYLNGKVNNTFSRNGEGSSFDSSAIPDSLATVFKEPEDTSWQVSLGIDIPFYEGGAKSAAKIKALKTKSQLMFIKHNTQNQISENIRASLYDISASHPSIELTRLSAKSATKNLDLVQDAYSKGAVSIVSFLDAQNAALVANTSAENAVYDFFIDLLVSERAAGAYTFFMDKGEREKWIQDFQK